MIESLLVREMLEINKSEYQLTKKNFFKKINTKKQIIFGNTYSHNMKHYIGWRLRDGGDYKKTAPYTIDKYGEIFEHYNPKYYSNFLNFEAVDKHIIPILIENVGQLTIDKDDNNIFRDYLGRIYNGDEVRMRKWKNNEYWAPYTNEQLESAIKLTKHLIGEFDIENFVMEHNTKFDDIYSINGVTFKSNYNSNYNDLTPAWDFIKFREEILNNDK